ncbi:DUF5677 domain-containing protein [Nocardiopsis sp. NPDC058789]|uniref:DUF5677 domain-containing protein n=1 Tax=Nocardiopsis sp. NPDC058789 TaxID=3346634 RepID=UPI00367034E4
MARDFTELTSDAECACGSSRLYGECCSLKSYNFGFDSDGNLIRQVPLADHVRETFSYASDSFFELYGRRPGESDFVFGHLADPTDSVHAFARVMQQCGMEDDFVYAFVRTDGLLPTEDNLEMISDDDLERFHFFAEEYREIVDVDFSEGSMSSVAFVRFGNSFIRDHVRQAASRLRSLLVDFLARHLNDEDRSRHFNPSQRQISSFHVRTPVGYCLFSAIKTKRTLESLERLADAGVPQSVYALGRSVFENTLFLDAIAEDESIFWENISPKTDEENYTFGRYADGRVNYNHVVHRNTGNRAQVNLRVSDLARRSGAAPHVADLYALFYVTACQFVHVDVLSARSYFDDPDPFDQLDPDLIANLVVLVLVGDLVRALVAVDGVDIDYAMDVTHALAGLSTVLEAPLELAACDPEHRNDVYDTLLRVTASWRAAGE